MERENRVIFPWRKRRRRGARKKETEIASNAKIMSQPPSNCTYPSWNWKPPKQRKSKCQTTPFRHVCGRERVCKRERAWRLRENPWGEREEGFYKGGGRVGGERRWGFFQRKKEDEGKRSEMKKIN